MKFHHRVAQYGVWWSKPSDMSDIMWRGEYFFDNAWVLPRWEELRPGPEEKNKRKHRYRSTDATYKSVVMAPWVLSKEGHVMLSWQVLRCIAMTYIQGPDTFFSSAGLVGANNAGVAIHVSTELCFRPHGSHDPGVPRIFTSARGGLWVLLVFNHLD